ncbi:hypothetical protein C6P42_004416 [Pichia californica]|nr:hypothetical protein C6P42_004416 [[Candida] californica]
MVKHPILMGNLNIEKEQEQREKKLVKLSKCKKMIISNRHLKELYSDKGIKSEILLILIELNKEEIFSICLNNCKYKEIDDNNINTNNNLQFKDSEILYIPFGNESWKCRICISWNEIQEFRNWMCGTENHIGRSNWNKCEKLLIRGITFNDNNNTLQDEKNIKFEYKPTLISPIELNIHVCSKN